MAQGNGKVAVVTGAGQGIGKAAAQALLKEGYRVALAGRRVEMLEAAIAEAGVPKDQALAVKCDVGNPADVKALFDATIKAFGRLDVLFNNAGQGAPAIPMEELTYEQWTQVVNTNLSGAFLCTQHAVRIFKSQSPQGGRTASPAGRSTSATPPRT